ncbi:hypothetical protein X777_15111 [Ooceraea biroi]|uniref:Uncharacterized protein n=1 Tax=Ooceraea biroi TaxID=2015173 RepID=A0A026WYH9_OOCBI|nr:hypothetical protein X777_15111 [Ooceraea biroi]
MITGDEKWIVYNNVKRKRSWSKRDEPAQSTRPDAAAAKVKRSSGVSAGSGRSFEVDIRSPRFDVGYVIRRSEYAPSGSEREERAGCRAGRCAGGKRERGRRRWRRRRGIFKWPYSCMEMREMQR